jgi:hypothetical protein
VGFQSAGVLSETHNAGLSSQELSRATAADTLEVAWVAAVKVEVGWVVEVTADHQGRQGP